MKAPYIAPPRRFNTSPFSLFIFFCLILPFSSLMAHTASGCSHTHEGVWDTSIDCDVRNESCTINNKAGTCTTVVSTFWRDCRCKTKKKGQVFEGMLIGGKMDNLPSENGVSIVNLFQHDNSGFYISDGETTSELLSKYFITGMMELRFGSFEDPRKIPVEFLNVDFLIENYLFKDQESGQNKYGLNVQSNQQFFYDSESRVIQSEHFEENLVLNLENDIVGLLELNFGVLGLIDVENQIMELKTQGYYELPAMQANMSFSKSIPGLWQAAVILLFLIAGLFYFKSK